MAILDTDYVDNAIGTAARKVLAPSTQAFVQYEAAAVSVVQSKAAIAGYTIADTATTNAMVQRLVMGRFYVESLGFKKGVQLPPLVAEAINDLRLVSKGELPIPGLTPASDDAIAGVKFSRTTGSSARTQHFSRAKLKVFS